VLDQGICFLNFNAIPRPTIELFNFANHKMTRIATIEKEQNSWGGGAFAVSPDGRWILYRRVDQFDSDIMLVENFR
jgi:hypothetical protein